MMTKMIELASAEQAKASDPKVSVFVSANAGTGKTKLLTDRVLRLLLAGASADSILCVTYTRAAAAEMRNRINKRLGDWTIMGAQLLTDELKEMGIIFPSKNIVQRARSLFAKVLDDDNGPRVETVHSFCQMVLHRFPVEAGITPHAKLADDDEQARLKLQARNSIIANAGEGLTNAVQFIAEVANEDRADRVLQAFLDQETRLSDPNILDKLSAHFETELQISDTANFESQVQAVLESVDCEDLCKVAAVLRLSGVETQKRRGELMDMWLSQKPADRAAKLSLLIDALFTRTGAMAERSLSNKAIREIMPNCVTVQQKIINSLEPVLCNEKAQLCKKMTLVMYQFGIAFWNEYERLKAVHGLLDYNDLINRTNQLLEQSEAAQWVSWKLDNGIQHLLIDEAQDTNSKQWYLLRRLADNFFAGEGAENHWLQCRVDVNQPSFLDRSVFVVGDFKQSIYSFQGADPRVMENNKKIFASQAEQAKKNFLDIALSVSFRSSKPILQLVNAVIPQLDGIEGFVKHEVAREDLDGFVELWPVIAINAESEKQPAFGAPAMVRGDVVEVKAAKRLADKLKSWIGHKTLTSGKNVEPGDILVLLRKRGAFFEQILKALQQNGIPVAGADRMTLEDQIEIQDLLALGDVMLLPEDDLQLAAVLRSPLCCFDDDDLFTLAYDRGNASLYSRLMEHRGGNDKFGLIADKFTLWRSVADNESVFGFYSYILVNGGRRNFIRRLGHAVNESLDHFLSLAQSMALGDGVSLLQFLASIRRSGGVIKRDMDSSESGEVRVMTIHGAKGLEAPIVILPDMLKQRSVNQFIGTDMAKSAVYWMPSGTAFQPKFIQDAKAASRKLEHQESNRLLYVALTRACEGLVIAGWEKPNGVRSLDGSDYAVIKSALAKLPDVVESEDGFMKLFAKATRKAKVDLAINSPLPPRHVDDQTQLDWITMPPLIESPSRRSVQPSQLGLDKNLRTNKSFNHGQNDLTSLAYGRMVHRLLEILPSVPKSQRQDLAKSILRKENKLTDFKMIKLVEKLNKIIEMPQLLPLFGDSALSEVPINGCVDKVVVTGKIDRIYVGDERIILADFKTGHRLDGSPSNSYLGQIALYEVLLAQIYPNLPIDCWMIWTETQFVEEISKTQREAVLRQLFPDGDIK